MAAEDWINWDTWDDDPDPPEDTQPIPLGTEVYLGRDGWCPIVWVGAGWQGGRGATSRYVPRYGLRIKGERELSFFDHEELDKRARRSPGSAHGPLPPHELEAALEPAILDPFVPHEQGALIAPGIALDVLTAGRAVVTLHNPETGRWFTYRVTSRADVWRVESLTGPNNAQDYSPIGLIDCERHFRQQAAPSQAVRAFAWLWKRIAAGRDYAPAQLWHEGSCARCGRRLTTPESIEAGMGPVCSKQGR